jgi:competence protein ComEC
MGMLSYTIVENGSRGSSRAILALTAILLILYEPLSIVYDAGFGLSFGATLGILIFQKSIAKYGKRYGVPLLITAIISVSIGAFLGSLPVVIYHFEQIAIVSLIANLLIGALLGWIL